MLVCLDEAFQLLLQAVVLVVQISHVLVEGINFSLQLNLVFVHLLRMLLQPPDLIADAIFILLQLLQENSQLLLFHLGFLALDILVFISLQQLLLSVLVLIVLTFKVPKF